MLSTFPLNAGNDRFVNVFMGTSGDHGQVDPGARVPFGVISVCPDSDPATHVGYDYAVPEISGISVDRISGVGGRGCGGNLRILPARKGESVSIVKGSEKGVPGFYSADLSNGVRFKATATRNIAVESYSFPAGVPRVFFVDSNSAIDTRRSDCFWVQEDDRTVTGWVKSSTTCNSGRYTLHFALRTDEPFTIVEFDEKAAVLQFDGGVKEVEVRIALSPLDSGTACAELDAMSGDSFKTIRRSASAAWGDILSRVDVKGSTREQKILFYTSLYRLCLTPMDATSRDGRYRSADGSEHRADGWTFYSGWSMWDTFRTKFPMLCLIAPREMSDICRSLVDLYTSGKRNWATMDEPMPTVRTEHTMIALLDAWNKGIRGFDMSLAFPAMEQEYLDGRVPGSGQGLTVNAPDQKMETVYDLWAMSEIAGIIGDDAAAEKYGAESETMFESTWKTEFKDITDEFVKMKDNGMYQGTRWQYRWAMPIYADRMAEWSGGNEVMASQLEEFFSMHLFNQGNEPDIQTPFMFNLFGHPEKTDATVHALLTDEDMIHVYGGNAEFPEPFVGRAFRNAVDGYAPEMDEDDGAMSAWYMFAQMGLYPLCLGTDRYEMFTPLFTKITLHTGDHDTVIRRKCGEASARQVLVDGKPLDGFSISHSQLVSAREIIFQ